MDKNVEQFTKKFPKKFIDLTIITPGYLLYRRRNDGRTIDFTKNKWANNTFVVLCAKYIFKYCYKGHDSASIEIKLNNDSNAKNSCTNNKLTENKIKYNEIKQYTLRVTFWNVRSVRQHIFDIETLLKECDILICVESWLRPDTAINFPGFVAFRKDREHASGGGLLLLIRKDLAFVEISNVVIPDQSVEMCGIKLNSISPPLDVLVCYRTPGLNFSQNDCNLIINNTVNRKNCLKITKP